MEMPGGRHALLVGEGAEWFALGEANKKRYRIEEVSNVYFWTDRRLRQIRQAVAAKEKKAAQARRRGPAFRHRWRGRRQGRHPGGGYLDRGIDRINFAAALAIRR